MDARSPWWLRLLDRGAGWGSFEVAPSRFGVTRYRLVVFPPGISPSQRRRLRVWRSWPIWGVGLWLALEIGLTHVMPAGAALAISTTMFLATGAVCMALADDCRTRVRTLSALADRTHPDKPGAEAAAELGRLAEMLNSADDLRNIGHLTPAQHEAMWWRVYDQAAEHLQPH